MCLIHAKWLKGDESMFMINGFGIEQKGNTYRLWHPIGFAMCEIIMPNDGQYMLDSRAISYITKALSIRYNLKLK